MVKVVKCSTCSKDVSYDSSKVNSNWDIPKYCGQTCFWYRDTKCGINNRRVS